jgi:glycosyltransferase involved in cell wall biosynthesis
VKIAFISTIRGYPWGGADAVWTKAAESALDRGDGVLIASTDLLLTHPRISGLLKRGVIWSKRLRTDQVVSPIARRFEVLKRRFLPAEPLVAALRRFRPDLVVFSCGGTYDLMVELPLVSWLRANRVPYRIIANWQREHPALGQHDRQQALQSLDGADAIFFLSQRNLDATRRHLIAPLHHASVVQIPLREDITEAAPWPTSREVGLVAIGRLEPVKGFDQLLHALHAAIGQESDWRCTIFGRGPELQALEQTAAALKLNDRVRFGGYVSAAAEIWANHHLFISCAFDEGVPMTIPEAMLAGRPALATCVGGAEKWIHDGETGYLCAAPTLELLASSVARAWRERSRWQEMGTKARSAAMQQYQPSDYLKVIS